MRWKVGMTQTQFVGGTTENGAAWRIAYRVSGAGEDVILLHGGPEAEEKIDEAMQAIKRLVR